MNMFKKYNNKRLIKQLNNLYNYKLSIKNQLDSYTSNTNAYDSEIYDQIIDLLNYELNTTYISIKQIEKKLLKINN